VSILPHDANAVLRGYFVMGKMQLIKFWI